MTDNMNIDPNARPMLDDDEHTLKALIQAFSEQFDTLTQQRLQIGAEQYGDMKFLENDVIKMLQEELLDIANYSRFMFIKLQLLSAYLSDQVEAAGGIDDEGISIKDMGKAAFKGVGEGWS